MCIYLYSNTYICVYPSILCHKPESEPRHDLGVIPQSRGLEALDRCALLMTNWLSRGHVLIDIAYGFPVSVVFLFTALPLCNIGKDEALPFWKLWSPGAFVPMPCSSSWNLCRYSAVATTLIRIYSFHQTSGRRSYNLPEGIMGNHQQCSVCHTDLQPLSKSLPETVTLGCHFGVSGSGNPKSCTTAEATEKGCWPNAALKHEFLQESSTAKLPSTVDRRIPEPLMDNAAKETEYQLYPN